MGIRAASDVMHGDVCRNPVGAWDCPSGCTYVPGGAAPYCVLTDTRQVCRQLPTNTAGRRLRKGSWRVPFIETRVTCVYMAPTYTFGGQNDPRTIISYLVY